MTRDFRAFAAAFLMLSAGAGAAAPAPRRPDLRVTAGVQDTGSEALPAAGPAHGSIMFGGDLAGNGGEGIVQSANSLPVGFTTGTAADIQTRITARYFAAQATRRGNSVLATR